MIPEEIRAFNKAYAERRNRAHKHECRMLQDRTRCPNCRTLWSYHCTYNQIHDAWQRIEARQQAEYGERVRRCNEDQARRIAAWEKRTGERLC
jgi:hypothetical protein